MLLTVAVLWLWVRSRAQALHSSAFATGYVLLTAIGFLALYNVRKKLPFLPLGSSAVWLQWHLYVGMGSIGVFALHAGATLPQGMLDTALAAVYLLTIGSGLVGLYLSRAIPPQLARVGREVIYEQIPALRRHVGRQAGETVLGAVAASGATTLANFYAQRLHDFFERPRRLTYSVRPTSARRRALMREMADLRRYLSDREQSASERLFALVRQKDDLEFHAARQALLKTWLFVHIALTCALVLLAVVHGIVAHAFHGGAA